MQNLFFFFQGPQPSGSVQCCGFVQYVIASLFVCDVYLLCSASALLKHIMVLSLSSIACHFRSCNQFRFITQRLLSPLFCKLQNLLTFDGLTSPRPCQSLPICIGPKRHAVTAGQPSSQSLQEESLCFRLCWSLVWRIQDLPLRYYRAALTI